MALAALALCICTTGCTSLQRGKNFQIKISAPAGTKFSCNYAFGNSSGAISTAAIGQGYQTILDLPVENGSCDINKEPPTVLTAAVFEGKRERFSFRSATNTAAFRLIRDSAGWRSEVIK
jgi:hypothetical protein